jgi:hypothetical protein
LDAFYPSGFAFALLLDCGKKFCLRKVDLLQVYP